MLLFFLNLISRWSSLQIYFFSSKNCLFCHCLFFYIIFFHNFFFFWDRERERARAGRGLQREREHIKQTLQSVWSLMGLDLTTTIWTEIESLSLTWATQAPLYHWSWLAVRLVLVLDGGIYIVDFNCAGSFYFCCIFSSFPHLPFHLSLYQ